MSASRPSIRGETASGDGGNRGYYYSPLERAPDELPQVLPLSIGLGSGAASLGKGKLFHAKSMLQPREAEVSFDAAWFVHTVDLRS
jgi:hypothetical protein